MPKPPLPPEEIAPLMRFIAAKTKNVTSPMSVRELSKQFKEETGSSVTVDTLAKRIDTNRLKIHGMTEFDTVTKVKMLFAISTPIDGGFLEELKKVAEVEVDDQQRIIRYKQKDGGLELSGKHLKNIPIKMGEQRDREMIQFLAEKSKTTEKPIPDKFLLREFKENTGYADSIEALEHRYRRVKNRIYQSSKIDKNTRIKMMFISNAKLSDEILEELREDADVEVDEEGRITKYKSKDGSLELKGNHSHSAKIKAGWAQKNKKKKKMSVVNDSSDSEEDEGDEDSSKTDESDEEDDEGNVGGSLKSNQASTSSPSRRSKRIRKSKATTRNLNKRSATAQNQSGMSSGKKRTRISYSSSEVSEDLEELMALESDPSMDSETKNNFDNGGDDFDYDPPINNRYDENLEHNVNDPNSERNIDTSEVTDDVEEEEKEEEEGPSATSSAEIESMSLLELLNHLRPPIVQYTPNLVSRIDENIKKLESEDQQIPFHLIIESLEMCIQILNTPDEMDPDENTTSLCDFFYRLERAMHNITHSMMKDIYLKIEHLAWADDTKISLGHIRYAMGKTIDKILH